MTAVYADKLYLASVTNGTGGGEYKAGALVYVTANAAPGGSLFDKWKGDGVNFGNPQAESSSFVMPARNVAITAVYTDRNYSAVILNGSGSGGYSTGETVYISASPPSDGKTFDKWASSDGVVFDDPQNENASFMMPDKNVAISAMYKERVYQAVVPDGSGGGEYKAGATVVIEAYPAPDGSAFERWSSSDGVTLINSLSERTSFVMPPKPVIISAVYKDRTYNLTVKNGTGSGSYKAGAEVCVDADPAKEGKTFDRWSSAAEVEFSDALSESASFIMPARDMTIGASYKDKLYAVTVSGGTGGGSYKAGSAVAIEASAPNTGMGFDRWTCSDMVIPNNKNENAVFTMPAKDVNVIATYNANLYEVTVSGGMGEGSYNEGVTVYLTADPASEGKVFEKWKIAGGVKLETADGETASFVMPSNSVSAAAVYRDKVYTATVEGGSGSGEYRAGETISVTAAKAPDGKQFDKWTSSSGSLTFTDPYRETTSFTMPARGATVQAAYKDRLYLLTVTDGKGGGTYPEGSPVILSANPAPEGQIFDQWLSGDISLSDVKSAYPIITMPAKDATVAAVYKTAPIKESAAQNDTAAAELKQLITTMSKNSSRQLERLIEQMNNQNAGLSESQLYRILNEISNTRETPASVQIDVANPVGAPVLEDLQAKPNMRNYGGSQEYRSDNLNTLIGKAVEAGKLSPDFLSELQGLGAEYAGEIDGATIIIAENITVYNGTSPPAAPFSTPSLLASAAILPAPIASEPDATPPPKKESANKRGYWWLLLLLPLFVFIGSGIYFSRKRRRKIRRITKVKPRA